MDQTAQDLMSGYDKDACSFVVRMWREQSGFAEKKSELRGWIAHVQSGKRMFFQDKAEIIPFMDECLTVVPRE